jgi:hypothetical protein
VKGAAKGMPGLRNRMLSTQARVPTPFFDFLDLSKYCLFLYRKSKNTFLESGNGQRVICFEDVMERSAAHASAAGCQSEALELR